MPNPPPSERRLGRRSLDRDLLDPSLNDGEALAAGLQVPLALLEQTDSLLEANLSPLQARDDGLEACKGVFESRRWVGHVSASSRMSAVTTPSRVDSFTLPAVRIWAAVSTTAPVEPSRTMA